MVHYQTGGFELAAEALHKSLELQTGNSLAFFFLAMAEWQLGHEDAAREWYRQAVEWMEKQRPEDEDLLHFRSEAAELLGMPES